MHDALHQSSSLQQVKRKKRGDRKKWCPWRACMVTTHEHEAAPTTCLCGCVACRPMDLAGLHTGTLGRKRALHAVHSHTHTRWNLEEESINPVKLDRFTTSPQIVQYYFNRRLTSDKEKKAFWGSTTSLQPGVGWKWKGGNQSAAGCMQYVMLLPRTVSLTVACQQTRRFGDRRSKLYCLQSYKVNPTAVNV
jgi:hypothetical protein